MFRREHHNRIATVLQALDADLLRANQCYFGGGTAIVLCKDEYRESVDIDFLVSNSNGYKNLRELLKIELSSLVRQGFELHQQTDLRIDQYGIRTMLKVGGVEIKFEIVSEGRIEFDSPTSEDHICGVSRLSFVDMAASKLLANSDRWTDPAVFNRDLIDLAMLELPDKEFNLALEKAKSAYGNSVMTDLNKAVRALKESSSRLDECMETLKINTLPKALLWQKIRSLGY